MMGRFRGCFPALLTISAAALTACSEGGGGVGPVEQGAATISLDITSTRGFTRFDLETVSVVTNS